MKNLLLVTMFFALVLSMNGGSSKPAFAGITCADDDCSGTQVFNFSGLNPSYEYQVQIIEQNGSEGDIGDIYPDVAGDGSVDWGHIPSDRYEIILTEIHKNGNFAHNAAVDEIDPVP